MRAFVRHAPTSVAMLDRSMNYVATSDRWLAEFGHGHADLIGLNHYAIFVPMAEHWRTIHQRGLAGETVKGEEGDWLHPDGRRRWFSWVVTPWFDERDAIAGIVIFTEDISERKRNELALRESEQRYATIFERSTFAMALNRQPDNIIVAVNDAFVSLFEFTREEVLERTSVSLGIADPESQVQLRELLRAQGRVRDFECVRTTKSGARRVLSLNIDPITIHGQEHLLTTVRDLTEVKRAEEIARLYEKSKELDALKTQLFANVSHELRTPLSLILGPTRRMLSAAETTDAARRDLELIERNASTLLSHVNDLLDVSKVAAGEMKAEYSETDLTRLARFVAGHFDVLAQEKQLAYRLEIQDDVWAQVDATKVQGIILNLLSNAFKFTPRGGKIRFALQQTDGRLLIEVADSGPGIPPHQREVIFERFRQLDAGPTRRFGGTGLGLAIAREFAWLHEGTIAVSDAEEGGARFVVSLPERAPSGSPIQAETTNPADSGEVRQVVATLRTFGSAASAVGSGRSDSLVLVVEDNPEMNQFLCESLATSHRVETACDGKQGLHKALTLKPDVILTDLMMPKLSGEQLLQALRSHRELDQTPIVVLTAKADERLRIKLLREGAQDYLTKPVEVDELRVRINNLILARRALEVKTRLAALVEQAPDGIFVTDRAGRITELNLAGCRLLGYEQGELIGKSVDELIPTTELGRLVESSQRVLGGSPEVAEWSLRKKDGTYLPIEVSAILLPDGRCQGLFRDISERQRLERTLRVAEAKASGILATSLDAIISVDEDQRITLYNDGAETLFGYSKSEALGAPLGLLIPERLRAAHASHVGSFAAGHEPARRMGRRRTPILGRRKSGAEFPADAAISKVDIDGHRSLTVILRDVTEQKRVEREQQLLADIGPLMAGSLDYEQTLALVMRTAVQYFADLCILSLIEEDGAARPPKVVSRDPSLQELCERWLGSPVSQQRLTRLWPDPESARPVLLENVTPALADAWADDADAVDALRRLAPHSGMMAPLRAGGSFLGAFIVFASSPSTKYGKDELRLIEEVARRAALAIDNARLYRLAQRAVQARDDMLAIVAHDLRNPVNAILLQSQLLRRRLVGKEPPWLEPIEKIKASALRQNRMIQDLLDVVRLEAGRLSIQCGAVDVGRVLGDVMETQRPLASSASLELCLDQGRELPAVWADRDRLLQIFENLIGNAVKFTPPGGNITLGAATTAGVVRFSVRDTGAGIPAENVPHLFDRFWQADKHDRRGAGLGLAIVKGLVEAHHGRVWVESAPAVGTTFFFTVPLESLRPGGYATH